MIRVARADDVVTVTLDRPAARNAFGAEGWVRLAAAAKGARDARLLVLRSAVPGIFSAGADLVELARLADDPTAREPFRERMRDAIEALAALPCPTLALVEGACHGAAVAVALACDLILASPGARFAVPPAKLGIAYPPGDVARLAGRVGQGAAARMLFTGEVIDAAEALRLRLVDVVSERADETVAALLAADPSAQRALKAMLRRPADPAHAGVFTDSFGSAAFRAATARWRTD